MLSKHAIDFGTTRKILKAIPKLNATLGRNSAPKIKVLNKLKQTKNIAIL